MAKSDFKFFFPFRVRCAETDFQGIVFNAHYLTYFDTAIYEYFRNLPYNFIEHSRQTGADFHTVKVLVEFYAPSHFDDKIEVHVRTGRIGRSSLTFLIEIFPGDGETTLAKGEVVWVNTEQKTQKSAQLPEELVIKLKGKEGNI
jgi:acyl-CoA thioester hydrolase